MIVRRMLLGNSALEDDCLLVYCAMVWRGEHVCLCAYVQSLFFQKVDYSRFVTNRMACAK